MDYYRKRNRGYQCYDCGQWFDNKEMLYEHRDFECRRNTSRNAYQIGMGRVNRPIRENDLESLYSGHPVPSGGGGIVNDPNYAKNKALQEILLQEQLKAQGYTVDENIVQPTIDEVIQGLEPRTNVERVYDPETNTWKSVVKPPVGLDPELYGQGEFAYLNYLSPSYNVSSGNYSTGEMFAPTPGYHLSYFGGMAINVPEMWTLNAIATNSAWTNPDWNIKQIAYMRLVAISYHPSTTSIRPYGIPIDQLSGVFWLNIKPNLAFPNELAINETKQPIIEMTHLIGHDGYGHKIGHPKGLHPNFNMFVKGFENWVVRGGSDLEKQQQVPFGSHGVSEASKLASDVVDNLLGALGIKRKKSRKSKKNKQWW